jgi:CxxC motif-containing protein (DUF1111 family)
MVMVIAFLIGSTSPLDKEMIGLPAKGHMSVLKLLIFLASTVIALVAFTGAPAAQDDEDAKLIAEGLDIFTRVWTARDGLGPEINARSCVGCHSTPGIGGSGTDPRALVIISPAVRDPSGGHVFRRLRVSPLGAVTEQAMPRGSGLRKAPTLHGSGLIEALPQREIAEGEGGGRIPLGRFGWKGRFRTIEEAVTAAFANELGLDRGELSQRQIQAVVAFIRSLPAPKGAAPTENAEGNEIFERIGCASCHRPSFPSLQARNVFPYTDLRLHRMGPALADVVSESDAAHDEFRTPPLWGIGRTGPPYLHDGRAGTLHEAVAAHGGEAEAAASAYGKLSPGERSTLLSFLGSL